MILLVGKDNIRNIQNSLIKYFEDNGYNEKVEILDTGDLTSTEVVVETAKLRPDIMIYIVYNDSSSNMHNNVFVSVCPNASNESKVLQEEISKNLKLNLQNGETYVFNNNYCSNYIIRLKPYPTIQLKIDSRITNYDIFAKVIYKSIISKYTIPKLNQNRIHKCAANLNMKTTPNKNGETIIVVPKGTKCMVLEQTNNIYWKIRVNLYNKYYVGYCAQTYIRLA